MVRAFKLIAGVTGMLMLVSGVHCLLPELHPHPMIDYMLDAKFLWHTVTQMKMLPGLGHALNEDLGVTARWKDFLRGQGKDELDMAISELKWHTQQADARDYGVETRFRKFLGARRNNAVLPVAERGEQFVARHMVNAFTGHWIEHYAAERRAQLEALEREEAALHGESVGSLSSGEVTHSDKRLTRYAQSPISGSDGEEVTSHS